MMSVEVSENEEISGGGKYVGRKGLSSAIHRRRANREAYTLRNEFPTFQVRKKTLL